MAGFCKCPSFRWSTGYQHLKKGLTLVYGVALFEDTWFRFSTSYCAVYCCLLLSLLIAYRHSSCLIYLLTYFLTYLLNYPRTYNNSYTMEHSPSWEAKRCFAGQEIALILWNRRVHYRIHKSIQVHTTTFHILEYHFKIILPSTPGSPKRFLSFRLPIKAQSTTFLTSIHATCPAHPMLLDFITRTLLGEEYKSLSSSLCSFQHSPVTSSLLTPNIPLNILFSDTLGHLERSHRVVN